MGWLYFTFNFTFTFTFTLNVREETLLNSIESIFLLE
jgi:hypothetical protein